MDQDPEVETGEFGQTADFTVMEGSGLVLTILKKAFRERGN